MEIFLTKGGTLFFGNYYQEDGNVKSPIEWEILNVNDGEAFLVSKKILDAHKYDQHSSNWESSEIRQWLNGYFFDTAFNLDEKSLIVPKQIVTRTDSWVTHKKLFKNTYSFKTSDLVTTDKVFLLSFKEATDKSFGYSVGSIDDEMRAKDVTPYAIENGLFAHRGGSNWWLRGANGSQMSCMGFYVDANGIIYGYPYDKNVDDFADVAISDIGVVPAIVIKCNNNIK